MHFYLTWWDKLVLIPRTSLLPSMILVGKIVKHWRIHCILSRWANWLWHTCSRTSWSINFRKWLKCSMHCSNDFSKFQDVNSWTVEQGYRYIYRWRFSNYIGEQLRCFYGKISGRVNFVRNSEFFLNPQDWLV